MPHSAVFSITFTADADARRVEVRVAGPMDSARYVDEVVAYFSARLDEIQYDRLVDLSRCRGYASYDDLQRLAAFWTRSLMGASRTVKVAAVTTNSLIHARMPTVDLMSRAETRRAFTEVAAAREWLDDG